MKLATIGFTQTTARAFFDRLSRARVARVIDVRLNRSSQLSGFAKTPDLEFFLRSISSIDYIYEPLLAPTDEILVAYKKKQIDWKLYELRYLDLLKQRCVEDQLVPERFDGACLLCSEAKAHHCHRRLAAEYLRDRWGSSLQISHI